LIAALNPAPETPPTFLVTGNRFVQFCAAARAYCAKEMPVRERAGVVRKGEKLSRVFLRFLLTLQ
jgi:hypothetical protein